MAKYCRHCGEKMPQPKDAFCYKCRKDGEAVDHLYRKIREEDKTPLNDYEQDTLREAVSYHIVMLSIVVFACIIVMAALISIILSSHAFTSSSVLAGLAGIIPLLALVLFGGYSVFVEAKLYFFRKDFFKSNLNYKIAIITTVTGLIRPYGTRKVKASHRQIVQLTVREYRVLEIYLIDKLLGRLRQGENIEIFSVAAKAANKQDPNKWICKFCGYENPRSAVTCKSCGKEK